MDGSPPDSSVHEISQARIRGWVAISFSWGSSRPRDQTWVSYTDRQILYNWDPREAAATQAWGSAFRGSTAQSTPWFHTFSLQSVQKYNSVVLGHPFVVLCYSIYYFVTSSPRVLTQAVSKESSFCPNTVLPVGKTNTLLDISDKLGSEQSLKPICIFFSPPAYFVTVQHIKCTTCYFLVNAFCYSSDTVFTEFQCQSMQKSPLGWASLPNMLKEKSCLLYILLSHSPPHIIKGTLFSQWPRTKTSISPSTSLSPDLSQNIFSALPSKYIRHMMTLYHCHPDLSHHHLDYRLIPSWSLSLFMSCLPFHSTGKAYEQSLWLLFPLRARPKVLKTACWSCVICP